MSQDIIVVGIIDSICIFILVSSYKGMKNNIGIIKFIYGLNVVCFSIAVLIYSIIFLGVLGII